MKMMAQNIMTRCQNYNPVYSFIKIKFAEKKGFNIWLMLHKILGHVAFIGPLVSKCNLYIPNQYDFLSEC